MNTRRTTTTLAAIVAALVVAAVGAFEAGLGPVALVAVALAAVLGFAERSRLARNLRPAGSEHRRRALLWAGLLAAGCVASLVVGIIDLGGRDSWPAGRLLVYNSTFLTSGIAAVVCLAVGLRRPGLPAS
jgi:hypothetical protein